MACPRSWQKSVKATQVWDREPNSLCLPHFILSVQGMSFKKTQANASLLTLFLPPQQPHFPNDDGCEFHLDVSDNTEAQWEMLKSKWCLWSLGINNTPLTLAEVSYVSPSKSVQEICFITERPKMCNTWDILLPCSVVDKLHRRHATSLHPVPPWSLAMLFTTTPALYTLKR